MRTETQLLAELRVLVDKGVDVKVERVAGGVTTYAYFMATQPDGNQRT